MRLVKRPEIVRRYRSTARYYRLQRILCLLTFRFSAARECKSQAGEYTAMANEGERVGFWC